MGKRTGALRGFWIKVLKVEVGGQTSRRFRGVGRETGREDPVTDTGSRSDATCPSDSPSPRGGPPLWRPSQDLRTDVRGGVFTVVDPRPGSATGESQSSEDVDSGVTPTCLPSGCRGGREPIRGPCPVSVVFRESPTGAGCVELVHELRRHPHEELVAELGIVSELDGSSRFSHECGPEQTVSG